MANDRLGSFSTEALGSAARPTSASPRKLTSDPNEKLVAMGQFRTHAPQQKRISFRLFDRVLMHINLHSPDGSAILSAFEAVVV
jgi:hypothetical protein